MSIILYHGCKISKCFSLQQIMMEKVGFLKQKSDRDQIKHAHKKLPDLHRAEKQNKNKKP